MSDNLDDLPGTNRRDLLKKGVVAGAVAWTTPVVLSRAASAQAVSPPPDGTCGEGTIPSLDDSFGTYWSGIGFQNFTSAPPGSPWASWSNVDIVSPGTYGNGSVPLQYALDLVGTLYSAPLTSGTIVSKPICIQRRDTYNLEVVYAGSGRGPTTSLTVTVARSLSGTFTQTVSSIPSAQGATLLTIPVLAVGGETVTITITGTGAQNVGPYLRRVTFPA